MAPHLVESIWQLSRLTGQKGNAHTDISGLLFGTAEPGVRSVEVLKTFADPGTHSDLARRERLERAYQSALAESKDDPELSSLQLVGWFSFRNSSGLLSSDVVFHGQHFRRLEDLALIIWRESPSQITAEFYSKSDNNTFTYDEYRCHSARLSAATRQMRESVELVMGARPAGDSYPRQYDLADPQSSAVTRTMEAVTGKFFAFLPKRKGDEFVAPAGTPIPDRRLPGGAGLPPEAADSQTADEPHPYAPDVPYAPQAEPAGKAAAASASAGALSMPRMDPATAAPGGFDWRPNPARPEWPKPHFTGLDREFSSAGYRPPLGRQPEAGALPGSFHAQSPDSRPFPWLWAAVLFFATSSAVFAFLLVGGLQSDGGRLGQAFHAIFRGSGLNLSVSSGDDHLRLTWNRRNSAVVSAVDATLQIFDGQDHREVHLNGRQLAAGLVVYRPRTNDVTFRLEVRGRQGGAAGSVRVLDGLGDQRPLDISESRADAGDLQSSEGSPSSSAPVVLDDPGTPRLTKPDTTADSNPPITDTPVVKLPSPVRPLAAIHSQTAQTVGAHPYLPASTINGWETPVSKSAAKRQRDWPPIAKAEPAGAGFVGPRPLLQVMPRTSSIPSGAIQSRTRVEVQVHVDPAGKVAAARLVGSAVNQSVAAAALAAARQWTFVPASNDGQHVGSDHTIVFEFRPQR